MPRKNPVDVRGRLQQQAAGPQQPAEPGQFPERVAQVGDHVEQRHDIETRVGIAGVAPIADVDVEPEAAARKGCRDRRALNPADRKAGSPRLDQKQPARAADVEQPEAARGADRAAQNRDLPARRPAPRGERPSTRFEHRAEIVGIGPVAVGSLRMGDEHQSAGRASDEIVGELAVRRREFDPTADIARENSLGVGRRGEHPAHPVALATLPQDRLNGV
jgi:hypothetical protein